MRLGGCVIAALFAAAPALALDPAPSKIGPPTHAFALAGKLSEISGLAPAGPKSVFAHDDEFAIVHEMNIETGAILRSFALGKPTVTGDFEGVAASGGFVYLVTSAGLLYEAHAQKHGKRADYNVYDTGLGNSCEIEGIAPAGGAGEFYLLCKRSTLDKARERLIVYKWSFAQRLAPLEPALNLPLKRLAPTKAEDFRAADIERDARTGDLLIVDSAGAGVIEITPSGGRVGYWALPPADHPQAEGVAVMPDGSLVVGDEGAGGAGRLTVYPPRR